MRTIYFDYNATTPLDPAVQEAMLPFLGEVWGNPSSVHHIGRKARAALDDARDRASMVLGCKPSEIIFTSGGTESNNLAILGTARLLKPRGRHLICSAIEHHAVLSACEYLVRREGFELTLLPVDRHGFVGVEDLRRSLRPDTVLVSVMAANNEIGSLQPIAEIGAFCRERGVLFHTDAVQWFGKQPFSSIQQFNAPLVSICPHKFYGPKGAGLLFVESPLRPDSIIFGGAHENERRAGTENLAGIIGLVSALERFVKQPVFAPVSLLPLSSLLRKTICSCSAASLVSPPQNCLQNTVSFVFEAADSIALLAALDLEGICASSGSACSSGSLSPSHVLAALGLPEKLRNSLVRFSIGRETSFADVESVCSILPSIFSSLSRC